MTVPEWVTDHWHRWPDGTHLACPVCGSFDLDDSDVELEHQRLLPRDRTCEVRCNDCQTADRDPGVIGYVNGEFKPRGPS